MKMLIALVVMLVISGCQEVRVLKYGCGDVHVYLSKPVSTLPIDAKARDVSVPLVP